MQTSFRADLADLDGNATVSKDAAIATAIGHVSSSCRAIEGVPTAGDAAEEASSTRVITHSFSSGAVIESSKLEEWISPREPRAPP